MWETSTYLAYTRNQWSTLPRAAPIARSSVDLLPEVRTNLSHPTIEQPGKLPLGRSLPYAEQINCSYVASV